MRINDPEVVAELQALDRQYEAVVGNDVQALTQRFWASLQAMRFGVTENLYGIDQIAAFRKGRSPLHLARTVLRTDIVTFGIDYGSVTIELERKIDGWTDYFWETKPGVGSLFGGLADCCGPRISASLSSKVGARPSTAVVWPRRWLASHPFPLAATDRISTGAG